MTSDNNVKLAKRSPAEVKAYFAGFRAGYERTCPPMPPGVIAADELYRLDEAMDRMGLREEAMTRARNAGLKTRKIGRRIYILGSDIIEFSEKTG